MSALLYESYIALSIILILFMINFINHFQFNYNCPYIIRNSEVAGIFPTLILIYFVVSLIILSLIIVQNANQNKAYNDIYTYDSLFCPIKFSLYQNSLFPSFDDQNDQDIIWRFPILWLLSILYILESYFTFSRYYNVLDISNRCNLTLPFTIYIIIFLILFTISISMLPIITIFLCIFHILTNAYFSFCFHHTIKISYTHIIGDQKNHNYDTYKDMKTQIKQVRTISVLSTIASIISAFSWYTVLSCKHINVIPLTLFINNIIFYSFFTKNKIIWKFLLCCKCTKMYTMLQAPCIPIKKRKAWVIQQKRKSTITKWFKHHSFSRPSIWQNKLSSTHSSNSSKKGSNKFIAHTLNNSFNVNGSNDRITEMPRIIEMDIDPNNSILHTHTHTQKNGENARNSSIKPAPIQINPGKIEKVLSESEFTIDLNENATKRRKLSLSNHVSDSMKSDISDIFTKMKSFHTFRNAKNMDNTKLAKELEKEIEIATINRGKTFKCREEIEPKKDEVDLERDRHILKLKKKANKQIAFGADIALEIINETIKNEEKKEKEKMENRLNDKKQNKKRLTLNNFESEPQLMVSYISEPQYGETKVAETLKNRHGKWKSKARTTGCDDSVLLNVQPKHRNHGLLSPKKVQRTERSRTVPNTPMSEPEQQHDANTTTDLSSKSINITTKSDPISEIHTNSGTSQISNPHISSNGMDKNDYLFVDSKLPKTKPVFFYNGSGDKLSTGTIMSSDVSILSRTQSLPPPTHPSYLVPQNTMNAHQANISDDQRFMDMSPTNDDDFVYDEDYFYGYNNNDIPGGDDDMRTPLTPKTPVSPKSKSRSGRKGTPRTPKSKTKSPRTPRKDKDHLNSPTPHTNTKSILGTMRSILAPFATPHNKSMSRSNDPSKLLKINSFLKQNGLGTQHHQNVNDLYFSDFVEKTKVTKKNTVSSAKKSTDKDVMSTIEE